MNATAMVRAVAVVPRDLLQRLARAVVKPGGNALLLDRDNHGERWVSIEEAVDLGRAFTVDVASEILAIDADSNDEAAGVETLAEELRAAGLRPVLLASGRPGGRHLFCRIDDTLLRETYAARALRLDVRHSIRPPGTPHRCGQPVVFLAPPDAMGALQELTRSTATPRPLPARWEALIRSGDGRSCGYTSRSEMC